MPKGPRLKWTPMDSFPGEYECVVGNFQFVANKAGCWDISVCRSGKGRWHIIDCGSAKNLTAAKRKCQQWLDRQWKAMQKMAGDAGQ